jgi:hypothetical protein
LLVKDIAPGTFSSRPVRTRGRWRGAVSGSQRSDPRQGAVENRRYGSWYGVGQGHPGGFAGLAADERARFPGQPLFPR